MAWGNRRSRKSVYSVTYKRRYWNGSAFVLESTARTILVRDIKRIGGLGGKLDTPFHNRILPTSVTLVLQNKFYKWLPSNTAGIWRVDATATIGYEPYGSEFTVKYGYILSDGTTELLTMFVGVIQDDPKFDSKSKTVTFKLLSRPEALLENGRAQNVGTVITDGTTGILGRRQSA